MANIFGQLQSTLKIFQVIKFDTINECDDHLIMAWDISSIWAGTGRPTGAGSESNITWAHGYFQDWNKKSWNQNHSHVEKIFSEKDQAILLHVDG